MTTHIFIVNETTFPLHLQYLFAGTGARDKDEQIGLLADVKRVRPGDRVIFYLERIGFYGVFRVANDSKFVFVDNNHPTYLEEELEKKLIYRVKIEPDEVYQVGVSEWEALDKLPLYAQDVIWSLIYRKLKGFRGCTPITLDESKRLIQLIVGKNRNALNPLKDGQSYTWDRNDRKIKIINGSFTYSGDRGSSPDLVGSMISRMERRLALEDLLQAYFTEGAGINKKLDPITGQSNKIIWLGNEVFCGVGMQKIDVFTVVSDERDNKEFRVIELKDESLEPSIYYQILRYVNWTGSYIKGAINSNIQPIVVARVVRKKTKYVKNTQPTKEWSQREVAVRKLSELNNLKLSKVIKFFEYDFVSGDVVFKEVLY